VIQLTGELVNRQPSFSDNVCIKDFSLFARLSAKDRMFWAQT